MVVLVRHPPFQSMSGSATEPIPPYLLVHFLTLGLALVRTSIVILRIVVCFASCRAGMTLTDVDASEAETEESQDLALVCTSSECQRIRASHHQLLGSSHPATSVRCSRLVATRRMSFPSGSSQVTLSLHPSFSNEAALFAESWTLST